MAHVDRKRSANAGQRSAPSKPTHKAGLQGTYGSGGSYGVGGGFEEEAGLAGAPAGQGTTPHTAQSTAARAARSEAQQDCYHNQGFEREVDPEAAPPAFRPDPHSPERDALAAKKRRGSRV